MDTQELHDIVQRLKTVQRQMDDMMALATWAMDVQQDLTGLATRLATIQAQVATAEDMRVNMQRELRQLQADIERQALERQMISTSVEDARRAAQATIAAAQGEVAAQQAAMDRAFEEAEQAHAGRMAALKDAEEEQQAVLERAREAFRGVAQSLMT